MDVKFEIDTLDIDAALIRARHERSKEFRRIIKNIFASSKGFQRPQARPANAALAKFGA